MSKRMGPTPPPASKAEQAAQQWHAKWHRGDGFGDCWCCCRTCKHVNPHYRRACRAAMADIFARIDESVASARPGKPP